MTAASGFTEWRLRLPLTTPVDGSTVREVTLLEGPGGWGEFSPLSGYPCDPARARAAAEEAAGPGPGWPVPVRHWIPVNGFVPAVAPEEAAATAMKSVASGVRCLKVKVAGGAGGAGGASDGQDVDRLAAVRDAVGPAVALRVDANGAWTVDRAIDQVRRLARFDLEMVEQPVDSIDDMARVRKEVDVPLAADECVRGVGDALRLRRSEAADILVVKVQPLGGVRAAMEVVAAAGLPAVVSSMYETSVGLAAGLALAAALPDLPYPCGLGTAALLAADVVADPLVPVGGGIELRRPVPDRSRLDRYALGASL